MSTQRPDVPDNDPPTTPQAPVSDPKPPDQPEQEDAYDEAVAESFPASDPPAAAEPGA